MAVSVKLCVFCHDEDVDTAMGGEMLVQEKVVVHEHCLYFASGLAQDGEGQLNAINGFLLTDISKELRRGLRIRCSGCHEAGGYVGCAVKTCKMAGHFPCLHRLGFTFQYSGTFRAYCPEHCPTQPRLRHNGVECCICLTCLSSQSQIYCPCCLTVFHKTCIQEQAWSAGLYHLRCAVCKNKEIYCAEMLRMGIAIPERDAQWEVGVDYASEDLKYCHANVCLCSEGRSHSTQIGQYRMRKCRTCGQYRGHVECLRGDETNECQDCDTVQHMNNTDHKDSSLPNHTLGLVERSLVGKSNTKGPLTARRETTEPSFPPPSVGEREEEGRRPSENKAVVRRDPILRRNKVLVLSLKKLNSKDISLIKTSK